MKIEIDKKRIITEMDGAVSGGIGGVSSAGAMSGSGVPIATYGGKGSMKKVIKDKYPKATLKATV